MSEDLVSRTQIKRVSSNDPFTNTLFIMRRVTVGHVRSFLDGRSEKISRILCRNLGVYDNFCNINILNAVSSPNPPCAVAIETGVGSFRFKVVWFVFFS